MIGGIFPSVAGQNLKADAPLRKVVKILLHLTGKLNDIALRHLITYSKMENFFPGSI